MENYVPITLQNLSQGAVLELIEMELDRITANILDANTDQSAKRSLTLTINFKPVVNDGTVEHITIETKCGSKLASHGGVKSFGFIDRTSRQMVQNSYVQQELFEEKTQKVLGFKEGGK